MVEPSLKLTISAGRVAAPVAIGMASGRAWSLYTSAAVAPACCASFSFCSKVQTPRRIKAMEPRRLPEGSAEHAMPSPSSVATSTIGAVVADADDAVEPGIAIYVAPLDRLAVAA